MPASSPTWVPDLKLQLEAKKVDAIPYFTKKQLSGMLPITDYRSVSQVLADPGKSEWFKAQLRNPQSAMAKACKQGTKTHKALETGEAKDAFTAACLSRFESDILIDLDEIWGQEEWLAHPLGYKGKFDGVGIFRGKLTLFDHKKTNKRKAMSGLGGYFNQLTAYRQAHWFLYPDFFIEQVAIFNIFGKTEDELGTEVTILTPDQMATFTDEFNDRL